MAECRPSVPPGPFARGGPPPIQREIARQPNQPGKMKALRGPLSLAFASFVALFSLALFAVLSAFGASRAGADPEAAKVPAPEFPEGVKWLNSPPLKMEKLRGKVVLIDFWE